MLVYQRISYLDMNCSSIDLEDFEVLKLEVHLKLYHPWFQGISQIFERQSCVFLELRCF